MHVCVNETGSKTPAVDRNQPTRFVVVVIFLLLLLPPPLLLLFIATEGEAREDRRCMYVYEYV